MDKRTNASIILILLIILTAIAGIKTYENEQELSYDDKVVYLQKQINTLTQELQKNNIISSDSVANINQASMRGEAARKSQDEMLTTAVSKASPAVVSIVVSKDVPKLEISYQNPFGDDSFFGDFGIQIPAYKQKGVEKQKVGAGTGFLVNDNGYIVTNKHVVSEEKAEYSVLLSNGSQQNARVVYKDPVSDIAIIKIEGNNYPTVFLGSSSDVKLGQTVVAIGNALGEYNNSVSVGIISGLNRTIQASGQNTTEELKNVIQTDAAINPGNSGGPLLDLNGNVIGVNVATVVGSNNISFAIPINIVKDVIKDHI